MVFNGNSDTEFPDDEDYEWTEAEIIRISNCFDLEVSLTSNQGWPKDVDGKMLIIENVVELRMPVFDLGKATYDSVSYYTNFNFFMSSYLMQQNIFLGHKHLPQEFDILYSSFNSYFW